MKTTVFYFFLFGFISNTIFSQNFTWIRGSALNGTITGNYGTMGIPSSTNDPGSRHGAATWVDAAGNLWLFGGEGTSSVAALSWLSDLWKYNPTTNEWTWVNGSNQPNQTGVYGTQGIPASTNLPGAREFALSWTDAAGNFWLFGGDGFAATNTLGKLGDLWKYNPSTNQWTWMKGPNTINQNGVYGTMGTASSSNFPGARYGCGTWTDAAGNLLLFGGHGFPASGSNWILNDLWKYDIATNNWTWLTGTDLTGQNGFFGTLGTPATTNTPGGKEFPACWKDANGNLILCGGRGYATNTSAGYNNDMWRYDPLANTWCWFNGSQNINPVGVYGTLGVPSATTSPGGRMTAAAWKDQSGNYYLFGGTGWSSVNQNLLNDLFKYNPVTNEWTWLKGSNLPLQAGTYGTMGVPAVANIPGSRYFNTWWTSPSGQFWLFGGEGYDSTATLSKNMNDLWRYIPPCSPDSIQSTGSRICSGFSSTLTAYNSLFSTVSWYSTPVSGSAIANGSVFATPPLNAISGQSLYTYYAEANSCTATPRAMITITVDPQPVISISGPTAVCEGGTVTIVASGASTYTWNTGSASATITASCGSTTGPYFVIGTDTNGCENSTSKTIACMPLPTVSITSTHSVLCKGNSATLTANGANSYLWSNNFISSSISVNPGATTPYTVTGTGTNGCSAKTVYTLTVSGCLGFSLIENTPGYNIFPNPNQGAFTISSGSNDASFVIYNAVGQLVRSFKLNEDSKQVSSELIPGIYFYSFQTNNRIIATGKLIVN